MSEPGLGLRFSVYASFGRGAGKSLHGGEARKAFCYLGFNMKEAIMAKKTRARKTRRKAQKRELIDTGTSKRYVRRGARGRFKEEVDQKRSLSQDVRKHAKTRVKEGQGDRGDRASSKRRAA